MNGDDGDRIKEAIEKLKTSSMEIGKSIYSQSNNSSEGGEQQQQEQSSEGTENKDEKKEEQK